MTRRQLLVDGAVAAVVLVLSLAILAAGGARDPDGGARDLDALGVVLACLASLPLVARRRAPLAVFAVTAAASVALSAIGYAQGPPIGATVALYFLGAAPPATRVGPRLTIATVATLFAAHVAAGGIEEAEFPVVPLLVGALVWGGAWVLGDRVGQRRERFAALEERALRAEREAERERRLAAAEERTRIARDLHDSAGHAINVILVQAGAARLLQERDPAGARAALETIEEVARETVGEIDQLVRALRVDGTPEPGGAVEPPPGLAALETLVGRARASGLAVDLRTEGEQRQLSAGVDRAAYRILQEALTNAARHGSGGAEVVLRYGRDALELAVVNPAPADAAPAEGHGLVGMRERAELLGGSLDAGAAAGVFRVRARLPYRGRTGERP